MKLSRIAAILCATAIVATALPASAQVAGALRNPPPPPPPPANDTAEVEPNEPQDMRVCFFAEEGYKHRRHCTYSERRLSNIDGSWTNDVMSIKVENARVKVCNEINLRGDCEYISSDRKRLPETVLNNIQSYEVL